MRSTYFSGSDALYIRFAETPIAESEEVRPGIVLDFDVDGKVVAIEVVDASEQLTGKADLTSFDAA